MKPEKKPAASWGVLLRMIALLAVIVVVVLFVQWVADNMWAAAPLALAIGIVIGVAYAKPEFRDKLINSTRTGYRWVSGKKKEPDRIKTDQH